MPLVLMALAAFVFGGAMGRLRSLPPRINMLPARFAGLGGGGVEGARRDQVLEWRSWYKTKRWQRLRWAVLVRDRFTCLMCGAVPLETRRLHADHVTPHRGDETLFFSEQNIQTLCEACHASAKQAAERRNHGEGGQIL